MAEFQHVNWHDRVNLGSQESARAETFTEVVASMVATPLQGINFHACSLARHKFPMHVPLQGINFHARALARHKFSSFHFSPCPAYAICT